MGAVRAGRGWRGDESFDVPWYLLFTVVSTTGAFVAEGAVRFVLLTLAVGMFPRGIVDELQIGVTRRLWRWSSSRSLEWLPPTVGALWVLWFLGWLFVPLMLWEAFVARMLWVGILVLLIPFNVLRLVDGPSERSPKGGGGGRSREDAAPGEVESDRG